MDIETKLGKSEIQHGKFNNRVYLMKLDPSDYPSILNEIDSLASKNGYGKAFAKVPAYALDAFLENGYVAEAKVPGLYNGKEDAYFLSKYYSDGRAESLDPEHCREVLSTAHANRSPSVRINSRNDCTELKPGELVPLADFYKSVFDTYPFPIFDSNFLEKSAKSGVRYFIAKDGGEIISAASMDVDIEGQNAEMTDFATKKAYRKRGLSQRLLLCMEAEAEKSGIKTLYTIARASSYGINKVFSNLGYHYAGTLHNNTQISGKIEDMNVWYKHI
jgi:beta-lysine N6-acetyltransferase